MMRSNLVRLMTGPSPECEESGDVKDGGDNLGDERRRKLVVDLDPPRFERFTGLLDVPGTLVGWLEAQDAEAAGARGGASAGRGREAEELQDIFRDELNEDQRAAVRKVITAKDYALLLGMPGTGKTWTIAFAVRVLLARGASVLITSYTHSAVDNLLLKLIGEGVPCLRIGKPASVHPGVRPHCINQDASVTTTAAYAELVASARVVGCTCLGVKHPLFAQRRFDYCVVDEAGQISQPVVLAPLRCADVFVLVGDHYQLPPLVTSKEALEVGMSESLFQRLCEAHPGSLQRLSYQYRMNGDVMALCNDLTYSGRLRCGNSSVEGQRLYLPRLSAIPAPHRPEGLRSAAPLAWLSQVLDPHRRVLFLDTDAIAPESRRNPEDGAGPAACDVPALTRRGCGEMRSFLGLEFRSTARGSEDDGGGGGARSGKGSVVNEVESDIVRLLIWGLDIAGFDLGEAGVISPYRSQVRLLQAVLKRPFPGLEINTIDKYQGRDKEVILVSFVRSNPEGTVGNLLRDWRRLNVALSRAKRKLLLLGSLRTLSSCAILSSLTDILQSRGWVYSLPPEAPGLYPSGLGFPSDNTNGEGNGNGRALKTFDEGFSPLGGQGRAGVHRGVEEPNGVPAGTTAEDCKYLVDSHGHSRTKALCVLDGGRTATHLSAGRGGRRDRGSSGDVSGKGVRSATGSAAISGGIPRASSLRRSAD